MTIFGVFKRAASTTRKAEDNERHSTGVRSLGLREGEKGKKCGHRNTQTEMYKRLEIFHRRWRWRRVKLPNLIYTYDLIAIIVDEFRQFSRNMSLHRSRHKTVMGTKYFYVSRIPSFLIIGLHKIQDKTIFAKIFY